MKDLIGKLALSSSGKDKGYIYIIYSVDLNHVYLVDGNFRRINNPKKKNLKHVQILNAKSEKISKKILENVKVFDSEIFSFIKNYKTAWNL